MIKRILGPLIFAGSLFCSVIGAVAATTVSGGSLLGVSNADQLEAWLGIGDQSFTNIWTGTAGVSTAASFHSAADAAGPTFSIYGITLANGDEVRIGGYTSLSWGGSGSYAYDPTAFIFNLDTLEAQFTQHYASYSIYRAPSYFATFGGGHDIFAGGGILGTCSGSTPAAHCLGYSYSHSYDQGQGQITVAGDTGYGNGDSGIDYRSWSVNSLEVYTFAPTTAVVPLPAALPLFGTGLAVLGFAGWRRKRRSVTA